MAQILPVQPGMDLVVGVTFACAHENEIVIENHATGEHVFSTNSHDKTQPRTWRCPINSGPGVHLYMLRAQHKNGPPDPKLPWVPSAESILYANNAVKIVGYEDANDGDYNDAVATVQWSQ